MQSRRSEKTNNKSIHPPRFVVAGFLAATAAVLWLPACGLQFPSQSLDGGLVADTSGRDDPSPTPAPSEPPAGELSPDASGPDAALREIEEADILKIVEGRAYVLNQLKGLIIIDVSNPDAPAILGRLAFTGMPVEMYVVDSRAYVVTNSQVYYPYFYGGAADAIPASDAYFQPPQFDGSKVAVIDISDAANPQSMGDIRLVGYANASRRVGDIIYVIGTDASPKPDGAELAPLPPDSSVAYPGYSEPRGFVASINVADPANIVPVARETFDGDGYNLHVSQTALFATYSVYRYSDNDNSADDQLVTQVQYVDISDAAGTIKLHDTIEVPGSIRNRFYLDDFEGVLRMATESFGFGFQTVRVFTYDLADPDNIVPLGEVEVIKGESLEAVRFDGPRGYLVTFLRRDPLFVVDLSDPKQPAVTGQLDVPGFSTHIEPRGERLIAVGIDDTDGNRPAVALYDVSNTAMPTQLSRIVLGPPSSFTNSDAVYDEKAFKIVDELGLIAIPFQYTNYGEVVIQEDANGGTEPGAAVFPAPRPYECVSAVQLIDYSGDALTQRGWFQHRGNVERVGVVGSRAYAMSQIGFQTVNIDDRDNPASLAFVSFLGDDEMQYFDGCGYYGRPIFFEPQPIDFFPIPIFINLTAEDLTQVIEAFLGEDGTCGLTGLMPLAAMLGLAPFMRPSRRRRR